MSTPLLSSPDPPTAGYTELVVESGAPPQEQPPPDQLYANEQMVHGEAKDTLDGEVQPEAAFDEAAIALPPTPLQDPLPNQLE